jgi:hypothetical protein
MLKQETIEIIVHENNVPEFVSCASIIQSYLDKELYVPAMYVQDFFNLMKSKKKYESRVINEKSKQQAATAFARISSNPLYQFEWKDREIPGLKEKYQYNTQGVFFELILAYNLFEKDSPNLSKDKAVEFFFLAFEDNFKSKLSDDSLKKFTFYKQTIISALLAQAIGFRIAKKNASLKVIFDKTRNAIEKWRGTLADE